MKLNKIALSLAGVLAAAAFAPEASALPLFARQTGMACSACHFQHFPMLNSFGRSFKASGYTLMGSQPLVEGEGLSLPSTLNMTALSTAGYVKSNAKSVTTNNGTNSDANGTVFVPGTNGEFSLFLGGRVNEHAGALVELGMVQTGGVGAGLASAKMPILFEVADGTRIGVVPFTTDGQGASYGFELLNTGANAVHTMLFVAGDANGSIAPTLSAQQYINTGGFATGAAFVANNSMGFINVTRFHKSGPMDQRGNAAAGGSQLGGSLDSTYLRIAGTFDVAGWDSAAGIQSWSGHSFSNEGSAGAGLYDTKAWAIDGQMQGEIAGKPVGFYASWAKAPYVNAVAGGTNGNVFNCDGGAAAVPAFVDPTTSLIVPTVAATQCTGTADRSSFNISTEWGVIPEKATLGMAIRRGKSGVAIAGVSTNATDNAFLIDGSYKISQNMILSLVYTKQSGDFWTSAQSDAVGSSQVSFSLQAMY